MGPPDDVQLMAESTPHLRADRWIVHGISVTDTRLTQRRELLVGGPAVRDGHGREVSTFLAQGGVTALGELHGRVQARVPGMLRDPIRRQVAGGTHLQLGP